MMTKTPKWNLVLITLDCVRPDHLGCYGYRGVETPSLDALAASGILFEQAVTHAPNTWVAHATLFTGRLPLHHGLRTPNQRIHLDVDLLAEWLTRQGYRAAAFPGNSLVGKAQGFDRGFELFHESSGRRSVDGSIAWHRWDETLARAADWFPTSDRPFLAWFHYVDTHHLPELELPPYFRQRFSSGWQYYDGKISYADRICVEAILDLLDRYRLRDRTIVMVFADHGEELRSDDRPVHDGGLKDDVVRVPWIVWVPPDFADMRGRIAHQARLLDLYPTACDLLGIPMPAGLSGTSLLPVMAGTAGQSPDAAVAYLENWTKGFAGVRTPEWKLILHRPNPEEARPSSWETTGLYHLPSDPEEDRDLSNQHPAMLEHLRSTCLPWAQEGPAIPLDVQEQQHMERVLHGLGYL
jgi:arylsulfatase A-like enzyme